MKNVIAKVETITPDIAKEYLKYNVINRPLNNSHVDFLARQMKSGEWKMNGEAICFEGTALVNGQHRLNAVIKAGVPVDFLVVRGVEKDSFITYDSGKNRSVSDVFNIQNIPNATSVSGIIQRYFSFKFGWISIASDEKRGNIAGLSGNNKKKSKKELLDEYYSSPELYQNVTKIVRACVNKARLFSVSEAGGLFVFLVKDKKYPIEFVESFYRMMFFGENISNGTIKLLREKIIQGRLYNSVMTGAYKQALLAKTWNCYVKGTEITRLSWNEAKEGKVNFI